MMRVMPLRRAAMTSLLLLLICIPLSANRGRPVRTSFGMSEVRRVFVVVLENEDADAAMSQPFLSQLALRGGALLNYHAVAHPSQPNYVALTSGNTYGIDNSPVSLNVPHLGMLLDARGRSWKLYAEDYPGNCFLGETNGLYARRHVPFLSFADVQNDPQRCARVVEAAQLDRDVAASALPDFAMYIPNVINDGHDSSVAAADAFMASRFGPLLNDPRFASGTLFVVVFDEGRNSPENLVYCTLVGAGVARGRSSITYYDHYSLLRTFEEIFHTGTLGQADAAAQAITDIWRTSPAQ